jgi:hypothetical protein
MSSPQISRGAPFETRVIDRVPTRELYVQWISRGVISGISI